MSLLSEKNIIESLQQFSEIPSEKCWESIAQNLPPVSPPSTGNTNVDPSSANQSMTPFFGGIAGKITAIATTAIVATSVGLFYYYNLEKETTSEDLAKTEIVKTSENKNLDETETIIIENIPTENKNPEKTNKISVDKKNEIDKKENHKEQKGSLKEKPSKSQTSPTEKEITKDTLPVIAANNQAKTSTKTPVQKQEVTNQNHPIKEENFEIENSKNISENTNKTQPTVATSNIIEKLDVSQIVVPNVFTPNNDGYNDYFVFQNLDKFQKNRLIIVNAKGNKVYERYQYDNSWNAPNLPDGSYFFILEITDGNLSSTIQGVVQVLR
ncbi:MAG: gliding motility-associated C-terminal domain-containing protein [Bacteroidales bacterium]|nr:gliding motility-associated C-terminal domain-containing protein [Bacteroidales bacterium]